MDLNLFFEISTGAITYYNAVETIAVVFNIFTNYRTLYFWSLLLSSLGNIISTIGFMCLYFGWISQAWKCLTIVMLGWTPQVTCFSLAMYSRLSMIGVPKKVSKAALYIIIFNHFALQWTTYSIALASVTVGGVWVNVFSIIEKVQVTIFFIQEVSLSIVYLYYIRKVTAFLGKEKQDVVVRHTLYANLFVIACDLIHIFFEYINMYDFQVFFKGMMYSIKLKLEFYILNYLTVVFQKSSKMESESNAHIQITKSKTSQSEQAP